MSIKLIAVDIDGTLVNSKKEITKKFFSYPRCQSSWSQGCRLQQDAPSLVLNSLDDLQLRDEGDYVVTFNGALVQEPLMAMRLSVNP